MQSISIVTVFPFALAVAFLLGFGARMIGLPPLVGFLIAGFVLNAIGVEGDAIITKIGDFGVMLLLFAIGLKLKVRGLARPEVWAAASLQMSICIVVLSVIFYGLALAGLSLFAGLSPTTAVLLAFAGSFSSTVFAVKVPIPGHRRHAGRESAEELVLRLDHHLGRAGLLRSRLPCRRPGRSRSSVSTSPDPCSHSSSIGSGTANCCRCLDCSRQ